MEKTIIISGNQQTIQALKLVEELPHDPLHEVLIRPHSESRRPAQNRLNWLWCGVIGNELGEDKKDVHWRHKKNFLVPIFERDDPGYAEMIQAIRDLYRHDKDKSQFLYNKIVGMTSSTDANIKQMAEFLTEIDRWAQSHNIRLPYPEEYYRKAMGKNANTKK